jgi:hypothetical protein
MWLEAEEDDTTNLTIGDASGHSIYTVYTIPGVVANLKVTGSLLYGNDDNYLLFAVTGKANLNGSLF